MSTRPQLKPFQVLNGDMSGSLVSEVTILSNLSMFGYDVSWNGTLPVGEIQVEVSNTYQLSSDGKTVVNPGNWTVVPFDLNGLLVTILPVSGSIGNGYIDIDQMSAYAARLVYTPSSGIGTLTAVICGKVA